MPERSVELLTWVSEENRYTPLMNRSWSIWGLSPDIGVTDRLEVTLPVEFWWARTPGMPGSTQLNNYGVEARYRLVSQDPVEAPPFAPLVRVSVRRLVALRDTMVPEVGLVGTYEVGSVIIGADLGMSSEITRNESSFDFHPAIGVSVHATGDLRFGAEAVAYVPLQGENMKSAGDLSWFAAGPNLSWTHGRFWLSATYSIGISHVKDAPRAQWGIAF
jgi:hypothetical protein